MCDTFVALPQVTSDNSILFAKNSDREPDEAQAIVHVKRKIQTERVTQCTYIDIPQIAETNECILSKPFQMWGAEMGANDYGLVIGNEAVFTKVKFEKHNNGLTGMDLLRLALERSKSASEAIDCITSLLDLYGQNANGGYKNKKFYYHNSFLISDPNEAWVLETAGKEWAIEKVKDVRSISNRLSISKYVERFSPGAKEFAKNKGWWDGNSEFSFQNSYSDWLYTKMSRAAIRQTCTTESALSQTGSLDVLDCMNILQTHNVEGEKFKPSKANTGSICMHATGFLNPSQTTGSMVAKIRESGQHTIWLSGTSMPCLSVYLPFFFGTEALSEFTAPTSPNDNSLWWRAERIHQWVCKDYQNRKVLIDEKQNALQLKFTNGEASLFNSPFSIETLDQFSRKCISEYKNLLSEWENLYKRHSSK